MKQFVIKAQDDFVIVNPLSVDFTPRIELATVFNDRQVAQAKINRFNKNKDVKFEIITKE